VGRRGDGSGEAVGGWVEITKKTRQIPKKKLVIGLVVGKRGGKAQV